MSARDPKPASVPLRVYYVERVGRTVTTIRVEAESAADAVEQAAQGYGEAIDSETTNVSRGRARWARHEEPQP